MMTPGSPRGHSSFRSKATGQYRLPITLWYLLKDNLMMGIIMVACDSQSVLDRLHSHKKINTFAAHADLLRACKNIQEQILCKIKFLHVKGHQDNGHPMVLSQEAWLNIEADLATKNCISDTPQAMSYQILIITQ